MRFSRAFVNKIVSKARICFEFDFNYVCEKKGTNEKTRCRFSKNFLQKIDLIASGFDRNNPQAWEQKFYQVTTCDDHMLAEEDHLQILKLFYSRGRSIRMDKALFSVPLHAESKLNFLNFENY